MNFARSDTSTVSRWWWTIDKWMLGALAALVVIGCLLTLAASPAVAVRLGHPSFFFLTRQMIFLVPAILVLLAVSLLTPKGVRRLAAVVFSGALILCFAAPFFGPEVNGAHRWIYIGPFSIQPSEFLKPAFVVLVAWCFAEKAKGTFPGHIAAFGLVGLSVASLVRQPDIGQSALVTIAFGAVFFFAGLPVLWVAILAVAALGAMRLAYLFIPHVTSRIDRFLNPQSGDTFQVDTARDAFMTGGLFGRGPGEGVVKRILPDAHTDYIFAVAGEEFGILLCLLLLAIFAFIVLRGFTRAMKETDLFVQLATAGLIVIFGMQAVINIAVNLDLIPSKGMTLPFISYGGSSLLALALGMGMLLALTRHRAGHASLEGLR